jgi:hypothetical protein
VYLLPVIEDIRAAGAFTAQQIAGGLNERGITAARGGTWSAIQVRRILKSSICAKADAQWATDNHNFTGLVDVVTDPPPVHQILDAIRS